MAIEQTAETGHDITLATHLVTNSDQDLTREVLTC